MWEFVTSKQMSRKKLITSSELPCWCSPNISRGLQFQTSMNLVMKRGSRKVFARTRNLGSVFPGSRFRVILRHGVSNLRKSRSRILKPGSRSKSLIYHSITLCRCFLGAHGLRSETGKDFANFGLESVLVFEGTTGMHERICRFSSK